MYTLGPQTYGWPLGEKNVQDLTSKVRRLTWHLRRLRCHEYGWPLGEKNVQDLTSKVRRLRIG